VLISRHCGGEDCDFIGYTQIKEKGGSHLNPLFENSGNLLGDTKIVFSEYF